MWVLGKDSLVSYNELIDDAKLVIEWMLQYSPVDFGLSEGYRPPLVQFEKYKVGRQKIKGVWQVVGKVITNCDGYDVLSYHNESPAKAFDYFAWVPGKKRLMYDEVHLTAISTAAIVISHYLYDQDRISHVARSGSNWDEDGELLYDQNFDDSPHIEFYKPALKTRF